MKDIKVYKRIEKLGKACGLNRRDIDAFYLAYELASDSSFETFNLGCVLMEGSRVIAKGMNTLKTDPMQKDYNLQYRNFQEGAYCNHEHSIHAEMSAIKSISYPVSQKINWNRVKAYIFRISPGLPHGQGVAAPCCACAHALADLGVKKIYFSTEYGFASSSLEDGNALLECPTHKH